MHFKQLKKTVCVSVGISIALALSVILFSCSGGNKKSSEKSSKDKANTCAELGPQSPRDIDSLAGENQVTFPVAPSYEKMNLCNIHFHRYAEHKAADYSIYAGEGEGGLGGGYQCNDSKNLTPEELKRPAGVDFAGLKPGDTIEVHWVYSSCEVKPGQGLGSCLTENCSDPLLRVEAQVFVLVNDTTAIDFASFTYEGTITEGFHQAKSIPQNTGPPVVYLGSTTGPKYDDVTCSPLQVTWSVRPQCAKLDINSLGNWLKDNVFNEGQAHGVRKLVTKPELLAKIKEND